MRPTSNPLEDRDELWRDFLIQRAGEMDEFSGRNLVSLILRSWMGASGREYNNKGSSSLGIRSAGGMALELCTQHDNSAVELQTRATFKTTANNHRILP